MTAREAEIQLAAAKARETRYSSAFRIGGIPSCRAQRALLAMYRQRGISAQRPPLLRSETLKELVLREGEVQLTIPAYRRRAVTKHNRGRERG